MWVCAHGCGCPWKREENVGSPGAVDILYSYIAAWRECWHWTHPLQVQYELLTAETSFQSPLLNFNREIIFTITFHFHLISYLQPPCQYRNEVTLIGGYGEICCVKKQFSEVEKQKFKDQRWRCCHTKWLLLPVAAETSSWLPLAWVTTWPCQ